MMAAAMQLVFFLFVLVPITVSEEYLKYWKLVNSSVQLDVQKNNYKFYDVFWLFNNENYIVKCSNKDEIRNYPDYNGRVEFDKKTHSLTLMNLQKNDSGLYEAVADHNVKAIIAKYQLYVLDPVEDPVLKVSFHQSNGTCNVTLTCEAKSLSITHLCYNDNCDMKNVETRGNSSLSISLYINNSFIICHHSNPVSWKNNTLKLEKEKHLCSSEDKEEPMETGWTIIISISISIIIVALLVCVTFHFKNRQRTTTDSGTTVYEEVKGDKKAESIKTSENLETPCTLYYTVGKPAQAYSNDENTVSTANPGSKEIYPSEVNPDESNLYDAPDKNQGARSNYNVEFPIPQTIYATVNKAGKVM
ncbi:T-lymphocyte activation antigen CD86 isoform X2 [Ictalurus punctatus]|uniref:T-lymphocyte activation antigen CD86 isoform X2 n=1 Tax=Ictalurus punctatus TaxID=7998 RepID=A0A9F7TE51_ICTPU|nr:T-lymphocyte activation antigen CD86 isoform X2 [Ictalurus punctatus]